MKRFWEKLFSIRDRTMATRVFQRKKLKKKRRRKKKKSKKKR